jgi:hypothetical protein
VVQILSQVGIKYSGGWEKQAYLTMKYKLFWNTMSNERDKQQESQ